MFMSSVVSPKVLGQVRASAGSSSSPAEFLSILSDAVDSTDTLTDPERAFLGTHGGVASDVFEPQLLALARQRIAVEAAKADRGHPAPVPSGRSAAASSLIVPFSH